MGQIATENWVAQKYCTKFADYPIYKTAKFIDSISASNYSETLNYYLCISMVTTSGGTNSSVNTCCYWENPTYTWAGRVKHNTYGSYDVYKLTGGTAYKSSSWNILTTTNLSRCWPTVFKIFCNMFIRSSLANDYKAPYDTDNTHFFVGDKKNTKLDFSTTYINSSSNNVLFPAASDIQSYNVNSDQVNNPNNAVNVYSYFGKETSIKIGSSTFYFKAFIKYGSSFDTATVANTTNHIYVWQDERDILNVVQSGRYAPNDAFLYDSSLTGKDCGELHPYSDYSGTVITNKDDNYCAESLQKFFNNVPDKSVTPNLCISQDYFLSKIYNRRYLYTACSICPSSSRGAIEGGTLYNNVSRSQNIDSVNASFSVTGSIKIFPPYISGVDVLCNCKCSILLNKLPFSNSSSDSSHPFNTTYLDNRKTIDIRYGTVRLTPCNALQVNNLYYTYSESALPLDTNESSPASNGFIQELVLDTSNYKFNNHPLVSSRSDVQQGVTTQMSQYIFNDVPPGSYIYPLLCGQSGLQPYISPGLHFAPEGNFEITTTSGVNITLNSQWRQSSILSGTDEDFSPVYESYSNTGVDSTAAKCYIDINGLDEFRCYIRSSSETNFDYVMISQLDKTINNSTSYSNTTLVKDHTRGLSTSTPSLSGFKEVKYENIGGGSHRIEVIYRKDSSASAGADKGYFTYPVNQVVSKNDISNISIPYNSILPLPWSQYLKVYHPTAHNYQYHPSAANYNWPELKSYNGYLVPPVVMVPGSLCSASSSIYTSSAHMNVTRIDSYTVRLSVTLPQKLGPFKIRKFAYHSTPSHNPFVNHDYTEPEVLTSLVNKISEQLKLDGCITATQHVAYKLSSNGPVITTGYVGIRELGKYYTATCSNTTGDAIIYFFTTQKTATCTCSFACSTVSRANSNGYLYLETLHLPELLVDSSPTRSFPIAKDSRITLAY